MADPRETAYHLLYNCRHSGAYSNIAFDSYISKGALSDEEKRFAAALAYGTLERLVTLDRIIAERSKIPVDKLSNEAVCVLQMGLYQLLYMKSVPPSATVNESVRLVKHMMKNPSAAGFVNGVLRSFLRDGMPLPVPKGKEDELSLKFSCPQWLVHKWLKEYGEKTALSLLESSVGKPPVTLRANTLKCSAQQLVDALLQDGYKAAVNDKIPDCVQLLSGGDIENTLAFKNGLFHVQDISSQICCMALDPKEGDIVIDVCSAPGGKAFTCAQLMKDSGSLIALDLHDKRVSLIKSGAERLGIKCITAAVNDARKVSVSLPKADKVLCDVVCSGLGVIRRKPEIKYKDPEELKRLPEIQSEILKSSAQYVKYGGVLVYSTCTVSKAENEQVVEKFLQENKGFMPVNVCDDMGLKEPFVTMTPEMFGGDGFFIAKLKKDG